MFAGATDAGKGFFVEQAYQVVFSGALLHDLSGQGTVLCLDKTSGQGTVLCLDKTQGYGILEQGDGICLEKHDRRQRAVFIM